MLALLFHKPLVLQISGSDSFVKDASLFLLPLAILLRLLRFLGIRLVKLTVRASRADDFFVVLDIFHFVINQLLFSGRKKLLRY